MGKFVHKRMRGIATIRKRIDTTRRSEYLGRLQEWNSRLSDHFAFYSHPRSHALALERRTAILRRALSRTAARVDRRLPAFIFAEPTSGAGRRSAANGTRNRLATWSGESRRSLTAATLPRRTSRLAPHIRPRHSRVRLAVARDLRQQHRLAIDPRSLAQIDRLSGTWLVACTTNRTNERRIRGHGTRAANGRAIRRFGHTRQDCGLAEFRCVRRLRLFENCAATPTSRTRTSTFWRSMKAGFISERC